MTAPAVDEEKDKLRRALKLLLSLTVFELRELEMWSASLGVWP